MVSRKTYKQSVEFYERKLDRVMERLEATEVQSDWTRNGAAWIEFRHKGELYRFDHSVEKAQAHGSDLKFGSDVFSQMVMALEDLARVVSRGIYELSTWLEGMKFLPPPLEIPPAFKILGFTTMPATREDVRARYLTLAKEHHPDNGGDPEAFQSIKAAAEQAMGHFV